ncbi:MAG TPA: di-heme-cytochrome C peroxidase [Allosphingosinicella sp.]|jgi:mono/diheme cytochrome c family protein
MISVSKARKASLLLSAALLTAAAGCTPSKQPVQSVNSQGWTAKQQSDWYEGTQGSRLMPWTWMQALEQPGNNQPFLADAHMAGFRFLPRTTSTKLRLPVGFALDDQDASGFALTGFTWYEGQKPKEPWIGLNCSACHTAELNYGGKAYRVDGGPSLVDFQSFIEAVDGALAATHNDPAKWERFAAKVLAGKDTPANRATLKTALKQLIDWEAEVERMNATSLRYGFARLDAFGHIFNKVALLAGAEFQTPNPADAPVTYPFIWDIYRQNFLQYNGIAATSRLDLGKGKFLDYGALGRNAGEVIGVFGDVKVDKGTTLEGFPNLIQVESLNSLEETLRRLKPLPWPAEIGAIDQAKSAAGKTLYAQKCATCHTIEPTNTDAVYEVGFQPQQKGNPDNTDPMMACNAITYQAATGNLQGRPVGYIPSTKDPEKFGEQAFLSDMLTATVKGALIAKVEAIAETTLRIFLDIQRPPKVVEPDILEGIAKPEESPWPQRLKECFADKSGLFRYKSRPLDGIWATAPFLHNGSVPTLYDLLLPADQRPKSFRVGTREFDPVRVGYRTDEVPDNGFVFDTSKLGNLNTGHEYGVAKLTDQQRWALVEYMKTL